MMITDNMRSVIRWFIHNRINPDEISLNYVNWVANEIGVTLKSEQVVYISDGFI